MIVYAATKAAQANMVRNLARQFAASGVTVNNLAPGVFATVRNADALADPDYRSKVLAAIPAGIIAEPVDIAGAALLLCSDAGRYLTGADIPVDGGLGLP
jgi:NAD(P)-dependent dehydrogenase (short-subunit alcohol dehydrogenase family)